MSEPGTSGTTGGGAVTQTTLDTDSGSPSDAGPEDEVKHELTEWMQEAGAVVFWEKTNAWDHPTFGTTGVDRPDLLVRVGRRTVAIETKCDASGLYRAPAQLQRYWKKSVEGDEQYRVDGERVRPDVFVLASGHSPDGRLFNVEYGDDHLQTWDSWGGSKFPRKRGWNPMTEYNATKTAIRVMWQYAVETVGQNTGVGIGALLSGALDGDDNAQPRLLYYLDGDEHWESLR